MSGANITGVKVHGSVRCNIKCDKLIAENLDFSEEGDASVLRSLTTDELKDFFVRITPYIRLSINADINNKSLQELYFYLNKIEAAYKDVQLTLKSLESESGTSQLEFYIHEEKGLFLGILLIVECLRYTYNGNNSVKPDTASDAGWNPRSWILDYDLENMNLWSIFPSLAKLNSLSNFQRETRDFLNFNNVRKIDIHFSNGKRFTFLTSPVGKLAVDFNAADVDVQVADFIKHILTTTDTGENIRDQVLAFDKFYNNYLADSKSLAFITDKTKSIAMELLSVETGFSTIISHLSSFQNESVSAKALLEGLKSI
jgi:predicted RNA binding protein with dsRBD fold (UPF0201 family)